MKRLGILLFGSCLFVASTFAAGCTAPGRNRIVPSRTHMTQPTSSLDLRPSESSKDSSIKRVNFDDSPGSSRIGSDPNSTAPPLFRAAELDVNELVQQVLSRNPSLAEMTAAWQAASARYPQVTSLEDPIFGTAFGPGSLGSNQVGFAYKFELSQKLPFPGKRGLRGEQALAEAAAAGNDVNDIGLQLVESAKNAFYEYYLVDRALEVNEENLKRLKEAKDNAESRVKNNLAPQQELGVQLLLGWKIRSWTW